MRPKSLRSVTFSRRAALVGVGKLALTSTLLGRMFYLQVLESEHYKILSEGNRIKLKLTPPLRGLLLDRYGEKLTLNTQYFQLMLNREEAENVDEVLQHVQKHLTLYEEDLEKAFKELRRLPKSASVPIKHGLTWEEVSFIEGHLLDFPGISVEEGVAREYPYGEILAHTLGYVQSISEKDAIDKKYLKLPSFKIGRSGLEKLYDESLRGSPGVREVEVTARFKEVREVAHRPSQEGTSLTLSLDVKLQEYVHQRLSQEKSASAVVMDVHTGELLVMASSPSFDPNLFTDGIDQQDWRSLVSNPYGILTNKAVSGQYAPGSTFKMIVALAGLESGIITPQDTFFCDGALHLGTHTFRCWARKKGGHGARSLLNGIAGSCDIYFYKIAEKIGVDRIAAMAQQFGLGEKTSLSFHNEKPGLVPSTQWKMKRFGCKWTKGETYNTGIGQGYLLTTPLQLVQMTARLATGKKVTPTFQREETKLKSFIPLSIKEKNLALVREGMCRVVNGPDGTAMASMIQIPGFKMAGKTGTSQVVSLGKEYQGKGTAFDAYKRWRHLEHALFVGFAPYHAPRYAVAVIVEHAESGSKAAAPLARDIFLHLHHLRERAPSS